MKKIIRTSLSLSMLLVLTACSLWAAAPDPAVTGDTPALRLNVRTQDGATTFSPGQVIIFEYVVRNTGANRLAGPVIVSDAPRQVTCPEVNTVGNLDAYLDLDERVICTASHTVTESDVNTGSLTNLAMASVGGVTSNPSGLTLTRNTPQSSSTLILTKTASPSTYGQIGQTITYTYTITNIGTAPLGPAQFVVTDDKLAAPINCGPAATTLAPNQPINCAATYLITQADMGAPNVTNSATASDGVQRSASASATITNSTIAGTQTPTTNQSVTAAPPANLTPGSTIQHQVEVGEWLIQIGRCYGANFEDLRNANPQIADPDFILPSMMVTVPRIGSTGRIWGRPCVTFYIVQSGDTWESIAQRFNADLTVLRKVNPVTLSAGAEIKIPLNSAGSVGVTAVPVTGTATVTATSNTVVAQRITIPAGQTSTAISGIVNPNQTVPYVLSATPGQLLSLTLGGPASTDVTLGVTGPTGLALKPPDGNLTWSATVTESGDHLISIKSISGSSSIAYTLTVSLTAAVTGTATSTITVTPTVTNTPSTPSP